MTRYVNHQHGLVIASGGIWSGFFPEHDVEWRATVCAEHYHFDNNTPVIHTPAQQLLWWEHPDTGKTVVHPYMRSWLEKEIGAFGVAWECNGAMLTASEILFRNRKDAMKLINRIKFLLQGMRFDNQR